MKAQTGDLIFALTRYRGQPWPRTTCAVAWASAVRLSGKAWDAWLAGKERLRPSSRRRLQQIGKQWILPVLAADMLERISGDLCAAVFERIERPNTDAAAAAGREPKPEGDVRTRPP